MDELSCRIVSLKIHAETMNIRSAFWIRAPLKCIWTEFNVIWLNCFAQTNGIYVVKILDEILHYKPLS